MAEAKIILSIKDGTFEIEGPESFVSAQLKAFEDIIRKVLSEQIKAGVSMPKQLEEAKAVSPKAGDYSSVFEVHEGKVKVITNIPGASKKEKTINAAFLCLFGSSLEGLDTVSYDDIRDICKDHGFYDSNNFSKFLKSEKALVISGPRGKQIVKLTVPGKRRAEELVLQLASEAK
jgi:hypothetical protein